MGLGNIGLIYDFLCSAFQLEQLNLIFVLQLIDVQVVKAFADFGSLVFVKMFVVGSVQCLYLRSVILNTPDIGVL